MSTVLEDVEAFRKFVLEHSRTEEAGIAIEDLFQRWHASRLSESELQQSLESLNRGLADVAAGRLFDAQDAIQQTRNRMPKKS
jgi:predicted transcriptional regulator